MQSIKQKPVRPVSRRHLPDFRNLGVVLRVLLLANLLVVFTVLVVEPDVLRLGEAFVLTLGRLQLPLMLSVLLLFAASPWLVRVRYGVGVGVILLSVALIVCALFPLVATPVEHAWRWVLWGWGTTGVILFYFDYLAHRRTPSLVEARLMALTARIRPHFLFNTLNGVLGVMRSDPRRAERALEELAELFRVFMRDNGELVELRDELDLCRRYLDIESLRLGERLSLEWHIEAGTQDVLVPPLMVQPLLENAIYHGVEPLIAPGEVRVSVRRSGAELLIEVDNPVAEQAPALAARHAGNGIALDNIRERLQLFFDLEARLEAVRSDGRYRVTIRLPFRRKPDAADPTAAGADRG